MNLHSNNLLQEPVQTRSEIMSLGLSGNDTVAAGYTDGNIILYTNIEKDPKSEILKGHRLSINGLAFNYDGNQLISTGFEGDIILWDFKNFASPLLEDLKFTDLYSLSAFQWIEGSLRAAKIHTDTIQLWDIFKKQKVVDLTYKNIGNVIKCVIDKDCKYLAAAYDSNSVILWDLSSHKPLIQNAKKRIGRIWHLAFSANGAVLASTDANGYIYLWNTKTMQLLHPPLHNGSGDLKTAFSNDGKTLVTGNEYGIIKFWNVTSGLLIDSIVNAQKWQIFSMAISPNDNILATGGTTTDESKIFLWDMKSKKLMHTPIQAHKAGVQDLKFSPDGTVLASSSWDQIYLWDIINLRPIGIPLLVHGRGTEFLTFDADGKKIASSDYDNSILIWDLNVNSWIDLASKKANRNLTKVEYQQYVPFSP